MGDYAQLQKRSFVPGLSSMITDVWSCQLQSCSLYYADLLISSKDLLFMPNCRRLDGKYT